MFIFIMNKHTLLPLYFCVLISILITCLAVDTISVNQIIKDGETILSSGENFKLGFFSPGTSKNRYVGIWYNKISTCTAVWVANTETPLTNNSGILRVGQSGLEILSSNSTKTVIWSTNLTVSVTNNGLVAQLLDTGNLVVRNQGGNIIWQSFDYPGDTLLSGMKIGLDLKTGKDIHLTSWKSDIDPSAGSYVLRVDKNGYPQLFETRDLDRQSRFGPWDGVTFNGMPNLGLNAIFTHQFVFNDNEIYYRYDLVNNSLVSRMYLFPDGNIRYLNWINRTQSWNYFSTATIDNCARYGICGPNGVCNIYNAPPCSCLDGFEPRRPEDWRISDWTSGCQRIKPLACGTGDGFRNVSGIKFPDTNVSWYNQSMTLGECESACKKNCTCNAYASLDVRNGGTGCLLWFGDLMDIRLYDENQEFYIRMPASELTSPTSSGNGSKKTKKKQTIIIGVTISLGLVLVCLILAMYVVRKKKKKAHRPDLGPGQGRDENYANESHKDDTELSSFSLSVIAKSTNNFSPNNKLGEGGFGPVYKGVLEDGLEIAVKRLSKTSTQGLDEFKNEVKLIAKLQHRNLVKLLGYCIQGNERMLIYEYMVNKSLDSFIFDTLESPMLDWARRYRIIHGIARGLLYLHHDSRLRIIHRDLKASNILLDKDLNPKISDFGLARRFSGYESEVNTNRVVGTYGYIPPEYAVHGLFSVKSDVYSFGVLVLEIVSGKKNRGFSQEEHNDTLIGHAWRLYKEGRSLELVSSSVRLSCVESQVLRSIHIGLLCVQHLAEDRPTMSSVVLMLGNENALPTPNPPAFFTEEEMPILTSISSGPTLGSVNEITITLLNAR
ncbi:G-type lectin S-receptor-like serine/threonine-protein kinase At4g27290 isoform X1 [Rutidosis leptorrhynchoides]|uniref:G-type lectin S-receptor-like serine/threonine-protein kinase At4g27290 isoform X1 n=1 Tax=Rutidosis leptorrhynchoides TaxID=125765 RepID=UPI003A9A1E20